MSAVSTVRAATTLALWAAARRGGTSADEVLAALAGTGFSAGVRATTPEIAELTGLPGPGAASAGSADLLPVLDRGGSVELLLPHAGDLRGLPPRGRITVPALDAGAVVVLIGRGVGIVPMDGQWRVFDCPGGHPGLDLVTAMELIDSSMARATGQLQQADLSRPAERVRERVRDIMLAEAVDLPPAMPPRASALLAKTISLEAVLAVAAGHETAALTSRELGLVDDALRPLASAVREGRRAAVSAAVRVLADPAPARF